MNAMEAMLIFDTIVLFVFIFNSRFIKNFLGDFLIDIENVDGKRFQVNYFEHFID